MILSTQLLSLALVFIAIGCIALSVAGILSIKSKSYKKIKRKKLLKSFGILILFVLAFTGIATLCTAIDDVFPAFWNTLGASLLGIGMVCALIGMIYKSL